MLRYIARNTSITELMTAIAENGYFPGEPIIVVPREARGHSVVEGNRRLVALKLLSDPSLYPKNTRVREIAENAKNRPDTVPCVIFDDRAKIVNYLGYRHITGVKQWEPLAKARYIAQYFENETDPTADPKAPLPGSRSWNRKPSSIHQEAARWYSGLSAIWRSVDSMKSMI